MRLGKAIKRLETRATVAAGEERDRGVGYVINYTGDSVDVDAGAVGPGQFVALDVHVMDGVTVRTVERVTDDADDVGWVYDAEGGLIGRVVEVDRPYFSYCMCDGVDDPLPGPGNVSGEGGGCCG